ncbi:DegV family protein [Lacticaseibacillus daqingensis]|uniref:DegV family protein n=1 Tax=Lacticaseibacillus daqingensis TaxID=2486014 RepID=UPI000F774F1E|nr:DegV family protein [Lacticaseibacillus daqingensis]
MTNIKLVTDSSIQMTPEEIAAYDIHVIPLTIMIDSTVYVDGETITRDEFMAKMAAASALPKTSQPAIGTFLDLYDELTADGSEVLSIHMLEAISGTVNSARQAAELAHGKVTVIDSDFTDRAMAFQVIEAGKMIQAGKSVEEIVARLSAIRANTKLVLGVSNLENMIKGGRLSRVSGMMATLLNIKVTLEVTGGELVARQKGRGMKTIHRFVDDVVAQMAALTNIQVIGVSYAGGLELATGVADQIKAALPNVPLMLRPTDPVIATHTGDGAFAITWFVD